jgi:hypothetical protein
MPLWLAIPFTIALLVLTVVANVLLRFNTAPILILVTAAWCALDSKKIGLAKYRSGISYAPLLLFLAVSCLWIVGFPWYLTVRHGIAKGRVPLKGQDPGARGDAGPSARPAAKGAP